MGFGYKNFAPTKTQVLWIWKNMLYLILTYLQIDKA